MEKACRQGKSTKLIGMDPNQTQTQNYQTPEDQGLERARVLQVWKERIYRFFYNIWPSVNNFLQGLIYHTFRIIRGGIRIALEQLKQ